MKLKQLEEGLKALEEKILTLSACAVKDANEISWLKERVKELESKLESKPSKTWYKFW